MFSPFPHSFLFLFLGEQLVFLHDVYACRNDRHKSDCICAVCQVTRRKKERDEILAVLDNETAAMDSNTSDQHDMEVSMHI